MANTDQRLTIMIAFEALQYLWDNGGANAPYTGADKCIYFSLEFYAYPTMKYGTDTIDRWRVVKRNQYRFMDTATLYDDGDFGADHALADFEREALLETILTACKWRMDMMQAQSA